MLTVLALGEWYKSTFRFNLKLIVNKIFVEDRLTRKGRCQQRLQDLGTERPLAWGGEESDRDIFLKNGREAPLFPIQKSG